MWVLQMGARGFPRKLDISKAMAEKLTQEDPEEGNGLSPTWLQGYPNQYTALSACCASIMDPHRACAVPYGRWRATFGG